MKRLDIDRHNDRVLAESQREQEFLIKIDEEAKIWAQEVISDFNSFREVVAAGEIIPFQLRFRPEGCVEMTMEDLMMMSMIDRCQEDPNIRKALIDAISKEPTARVAAMNRLPKGDTYEN